MEGMTWNAMQRNIRTALRSQHDNRRFNASAAKSTVPFPWLRGMRAVRRNENVTVGTLLGGEHFAGGRPPAIPLTVPWLLRSCSRLAKIGRP